MTLAFDPQLWNPGSLNAVELKMRADRISIRAQLNDAIAQTMCEMLRAFEGTERLPYGSVAEWLEKTEYEIPVPDWAPSYPDSMPIDVSTVRKALAAACFVTDNIDIHITLRLKSHIPETYVFLITFKAQQSHDVIEFDGYHNQAALFALANQS